MRGEAKLRILNFKTTWSEFQKPYQTAAARGEAELRIYNLKKTSPTQSRSQAVVCVSTPRMYPRSGYFLVITIIIQNTYRVRNKFLDTLDMPFVDKCSDYKVY